ncbi:hypothetical protein [Sediminicola luteus]|nr:hypothetical protein [Sediminicola luteus]
MKLTKSKLDSNGRLTLHFCPHTAAYTLYNAERDVRIQICSDCGEVLKEL